MTASNQVIYNPHTETMGFNSLICLYFAGY